MQNFVLQEPRFSAASSDNIWPSKSSSRCLNRGCPHRPCRWCLRRKARIGSVPGPSCSTNSANCIASTSSPEALKTRSILSRVRWAARLNSNWQRNKHDAEGLGFRMQVFIGSKYYNRYDPEAPSLCSQMLGATIVTPPKGYPPICRPVRLY